MKRRNFNGSVVFSCHFLMSENACFGLFRVGKVGKKWETFMEKAPEPSWKRHQEGDRICRRPVQGNAHVSAEALFREHHPRRDSGVYGDKPEQMLQVFQEKVRPDDIRISEPVSYP